MTARKTSAPTEDEAMDRPTPVPAHERSEGSGPRIPDGARLAAGYEALAALRTDQGGAAEDGLRRNMARLAGRG